MKLSPDVRRRVVSDHAELWVDLAARCAKADRAKWDALLCLLDNVYGTTVIAPVKQNAPFWVPQSPKDDSERAHYDVLSDFAVELEVPEFDSGDEDELPDEHWAEVEKLHVETLAASLDEGTALEALRGLGDPNSYSIAWSPPTDSGYFVHMRHLRGARLAEPVAPTTAYAALAPLFWHANSYVGRLHSGLAFDGDTLVEATLFGADVTDETLALMTPERAACCSTLRSLTLDKTRTSAQAVERVRGLLKATQIVVT